MTERQERETMTVRKIMTMNIMKIIMMTVSNLYSKERGE
jgi:hypothetical protein